MTERTYMISRDQWQRIRVDVKEDGCSRLRQLKSLEVYGGGFEIGMVPGALDLALAILVDHAAVPVEQAQEAFRGGFRTADTRLLYCWMKHVRLRDQRLASSLRHPSRSVDYWEIHRLLKGGFLTPEAEKSFNDGVLVRENTPALWVSDEFKKPGGA